MKLYLDKLNKKPRLKKCLKILGTIFIVLNILWYFLLNIVFVISACNSTIQVESKSIENKATTPIKNSIGFRYSHAIALSDFVNPVWSEDIYNYLSTHDNVGNSGLTHEQWLNGSALSITNSSSVRAFTISTDLTTINYRTNYSFTGLTFSCLNNGNTDYPAFSVSYYANVSGVSVRMLSRNIRYSTYITSEGNEPVLSSYSWSGQLFYQYYNNGAWVPLEWNYAYDYIELSEDNYVGWISSGNFDGQSYYNEGYDAGYDNGYYNGQNVGSEEGYRRGYLEGLNAGAEGETTMFTLIKQAFNSVASILNIQVLPNLSLGLLLFTPIIVSLVIVLVRMIKG